MTLLEYLFGNMVSTKTDAERYMEERNREYAKKAAAYKKREMLGEVQKTIFDHLIPVAKINNYATVPQSQSTNRTQVRTTYDVPQTTYRTEMDYRDAAAETKRRLQEKYGCATQSESDCNTCDSSELDLEDASVFEINTVMFDQMKQVYKVCGKIKRGRFSVNDIVTVKNGTNHYAAKIRQIIRQGENIDYANVSSGVIILFLPTSGGLKMDKASKITKSTLN